MVTSSCEWNKFECDVKQQTINQLCFGFTFWWSDSWSCRTERRGGRPSSLWWAGRGWSLAVMWHSKIQTCRVQIHCLWSFHSDLNWIFDWSLTSVQKVFHSYRTVFCYISWYIYTFSFDILILVRFFWLPI